MVRVRSPQDLGAALIFIAIGVAALAFRGDLQIGDASKMGPAYFPTILGWLILLIGFVLGVISLKIDGPPIQKVQFRPLLLIVGAVLLFGYLLETVGLALSAIAITLVAAYARRGASWKESLVLGAGLAVFVISVFVLALNQPLPLWFTEPAPDEPVVEAPAEVTPEAPPEPEPEKK
jgi:hypothetical protein